MRIISSDMGEEIPGPSVIERVVMGNSLTKTEQVAQLEKRCQQWQEAMCTVSR